VKKKIVIIGAASAVFGVKMIQDISLSPEMDDVEVVLVDVNERDLDIVFRFAKRLFERQGREIHLSMNSDREAALPGTDFVILAVSVNKNVLWKQEFEIPIRHGLAQTQGENGGVAGLFHSLRSIHVVLPIIQDVERLCPEAIVLNYTNPLSRVCMAANELSSVKVIGLCHEMLNKLGKIAEWTGVPSDDIEAVSAGLNHIPFILEIHRKSTGEDLYPLIREKIPRSGPDAMHLCNLLMDTLGYLPATDDRHCGEYISFATEYCDPRPAKLFAGGTKWRDGRFALYDRIAHAEADFEDAMLEKSNERAIGILLAITSDANALEDAVNIPNKGIISNLPEDAIVEVPGYFDKDGVSGKPIGDLPAPIAALLRPQVEVQRMIVKAYKEHSKDLALQAIMVDPAVPQFKQAKKAFDELLALEAEYLPELN